MFSVELHFCESVSDDQQTADDVVSELLIASAMYATGTLTATEA